MRQNNRVNLRIGFTGDARMDDTNFGVAEVGPPG